MAPKGKNGNIFAYFKPKPQTAASHDPPQIAPQAGERGPASSPSLPLSLLNTPTKQTPQRPAPLLEVEASDDDDDGGSGSDDSLLDLSTLLSRGGGSERPVHNQPKAIQNPYSTPRAKRTAVGYHSSPLAIIPKHKFDLGALANDARKDEAADLSSILAAVHNDEDDDLKQNIEPGADGTGGDAALREMLKDNSRQDAHKVIRAVERAESGRSQMHHLFFEQDFQPPPTLDPPKAFHSGTWRILTHAEARVREQNLASGLPLTVLKKGRKPPDEIFEWMLNQVCTQPSPLMREEYTNLINCCPEQIWRLVTPAKILDMFVSIGAIKDIKETPMRLSIYQKVQDPYKNREWGYLRSFITLLKLICSKLQESSLLFAAQTFFRMSVDGVVISNMDIFVEYGESMRCITEAIPTKAWSNFSLHAAEMLSDAGETNPSKLNALLCLPTDCKATHNLRRRVAIALLFEDATLARHCPDEVVTICGVADRLREDDFQIDLKTDFAGLTVKMILLDMVIDDGSFYSSDDPKKEKEFNEDIDELANQLRGIWRKINDSGMKLARTEAKSVIELVQQRLSYSVRTRRKAKKNIFDTGPKEDVGLPQQRQFMNHFLERPHPAAVKGPD